MSETLAERCEKATGLDRELDAMIAVAIDFRAKDSVPAAARAFHTDYGGNNSYADIGAHWPRLPYFTASLDAAMTLVPEGSIWDVSSTGCSWVMFDGMVADQVTAKAATPALALCAAALRALTHQTAEERDGD